MGTNFNYDDTDHQAIFDRINGGAGSDSLQEASRAWQRLGDDVGVAGKSYVQSAIRGILTAREGAAAQAAAEATGAMVPWMDDVAMIATAASRRVQGQADFWANAKHNIPPVPPAPVPASFLGAPTEWFAQKMDWFPGLTTEEEKAQQRQQDAAEQARQAMRLYQSSSNGNIDQPPAFTTPQALDNNLGSLPLTSARVDGATVAPPAASGSGPLGHAGAAAAQLAAHQPAAQQPASTMMQLAAGGPAGAGSDALVSGRGPSHPTPGQGVTPGPIPVGTGLGDGATRRGPTRPASVRGATAGARLPGTGSSGGMGRGGGVPGGARGGGGVPGGVGHAGLKGLGSGLGSQSSAGFGPRPTASAYPSAEGVGGVRSGGVSASTAGGARGAAGFGDSFAGAGGAGQRGEQDREYRTKYLVHDDSHSIVGDLPPTAPPVIGADPDY